MVLLGSCFLTPFYATFLLWYRYSKSSVVVGKFYRSLIRFWWLRFLQFFLE